MAETRKGLVARTASLNNKRGLLCGGGKKRKREREKERERKDFSQGKAQTFALILPREKLIFNSRPLLLLSRLKIHPFHKFISSLYSKLATVGVLSLILSNQFH